MTTTVSAKRRFDHWIDGAPVGPTAHRFLDSRSPVDSSIVARIARGDEADVALAVESARRAQPDWAAQTPERRSRVLHAIADAIRANSDELRDVECSETGKLPVQVDQEVAGSANYFEYYAGVLRALHGETVDLGPNQHIFTRHEPYGVIGVITPWNGPLNQCCRGVAPALAVGNSVVAKPSEYTSGSTVVLGRLASAAGLPDGVLNIVTGTGPEVGAALVRHDAVARVTFTGSVATGRAIARMASERLIPVTLELGGKSPHILFANADLDRAIPTVARAFTSNAGQACSAGTRLLVDRAIEGEVVERLAKALGKIRPGDQMGPIITAPQFDKVQHYLQVGREDGAHVAVGGRVARALPGLEKGQYVEPTVFTGVTNDMRIAREEIFGPVLCVIAFADEAEAIAIANDTDFGLVAGLWTNDVSQALRVAQKLEAGQVFVNDWTANVEVPFGGYKQSGYGREKGFAALLEYTRLKSVMVRLA